MWNELRPLTEKELSELPHDQLKKRLEFVESQAAIEKDTEQSLKLWMNSSYGALGSPYFYFSNAKVAEGITSTGKSIILYTEKITNEYFSKYWHKDKELHKILGIEEVKPLKTPVVVYAHTDSCAYTTKIKIRRIKNSKDI